MKKQLFLYIFSGLLLINFQSFGQPTNYSTKKINGIDYYQYTVQVSEGLFAIGRKFNVSPDDITKANPEIASGLKAGQQLLIPVKKNATVQNNSEKKPKLEFTEHKVDKKQTLFAISNKYGVSQEDIRKYNPEIENGLHEGMALRIPKQTKEESKQEVEKIVPEKAEKTVIQERKTDKKSFIIHIVEPDETLYSISRRYKVEVADLVAINPASAVKLSIGTELKVPAKEGALLIQKKETTTNTPKQNLDINTLLSNNLTVSSSNKSKIIRIAFLLPFMLDQDKKDASVDRFVDFYAGALLAIKAAKQKGISMEIYTYDTEKSEEKLNEVLSNSELKTMDLIIGPAFTNQVSLIGDFAKENRISTLIPFSSKVSDIESNPYLFQFNPGNETELNVATELFTGKYKNMHIIFAEIPGISSLDEGKIWVDGLKKELKKGNKSYSTLQLSTSDLADFSSVLKSNGKNLIIFNTDKFAYVSPFIAALKTLPSQYSIVLFEKYNWKNQAEKLPSGLYFSPFTTAINSEKLDKYNKEFTYYFGKAISKELPRYDLLGYDLSAYFISVINKYGNKFNNKIGSYNFSDGLQSKPQFERTSNNSGFVNQQVYTIED